MLLLRVEIQQGTVATQEPACAEVVIPLRRSGRRDAFREVEVPGGSVSWFTRPGVCAGVSPSALEKGRSQALPARCSDVSPERFVLGRLTSVALLWDDDELGWRLRHLVRAGCW